MKNFEKFLIKTSELNGIVDFLNWMNRENFQPSSDDNTTWIHVGSDGAEEYQPFELLKKYEESINKTSSQI
ncbi:MAG TPA: hypothetical protein VL443_30110 [Cyclobacteriaceae bacterium]|jgi:hypothetical protein|nr:hypothetical protein [Cyclobacteriaceae bacterium]